MPEEDYFTPVGIITRSLIYFAKKMTDLKSDGDLQVGGILIGQGLDATARAYTELALEVEDKKNDFSMLVSLNTTKICAALTIYEADLKASHKALFEKLTGGQKSFGEIDLKMFDLELKSIESTRQRFCPKKES